MNPELELISEYMSNVGRSILGRSVYEATFAEFMKPYSHATSVILAAQAAEIIIKARIAQEHPLLIFESLPKSSTTEDLLSIAEILEHGKTINFRDLPERLWAVTGYRMSHVQSFLEFGKLRNRIMHLAPLSEKDLSDETLKFVFNIIDPLIENFWNDTVIEYIEVWDDVIIVDGHLEERLNELEISLTRNAKKSIKSRTQ